MSHKPEFDEISGTDTTGHEWDGIKELNTPLPRWWLYVMYVTIVWSVLFIAFPMVFGDNPIINATGFKGSTSQREYVDRAVADVEASRAQYYENIAAMDLENIRADASLMEVALAAGEAAFGDNCAPCHGSGAQVAVGVPNLNDDAWLWGGTLDDIHTTLRHGIRWEADEDTRMSQMPAFVKDEWFDADAALDVAHFVRMISGQEADQERAARGSVVFADNCAVCHGAEGTGDQMQGAPNLTDAIWLYAGDVDTIVHNVSVGPGTGGMGGVMPAWGDRLDPATVKALTLYVHSLGGGK